MRVSILTVSPFVDEEGNVNSFASLEDRRLRDIARGITAQSFRRFDHFHLDGRRQLHLHRTAFRVEHLNR